MAGARHAHAPIHSSFGGRRVRPGEVVQEDALGCDASSQRRLAASLWHGGSARDGGLAASP
eukprot:7301450-Lingulodinium_polyedra.AAC.1